MELDNYLKINIAQSMQLFIIISFVSSIELPISTARSITVFAPTSFAISLVRHFLLFVVVGELTCSSRFITAFFKLADFCVVVSGVVMGG